MTLRTIADVISHPIGTARLLEGFSTLYRANQSGVKPDQMRAIFTDLDDCCDTEIRGFVKIGSKLVRGEARLPNKAFADAKSTAPIEV